MDWFGPCFERPERSSIIYLSVLIMFVIVKFTCHQWFQGMRPAQAKSRSQYSCDIQLMKMDVDGVQLWVVHRKRDNDLTALAVAADPVPPLKLAKETVHL
jgi:hypothetical protein